jgi:hypothetical protein
MNGSNTNSNDTSQAQQQTVQQQQDATAPKAAAAMIKKLLILGTVIGGVNALAAGLVPMRYPHWFTYDPLIVHEMRGYVHTL